MEMEAGGSSSRKRKSAGLDRDEAAAAVVVAAEGHGEEHAAEEEAPPLPVADGDAVNVHTNHLPDGLLADNNSLIPTEEGARASKKRKSAGFDSLEAAAAAEGHGPEPAAEDQEPPLPVAGGGAVNDHINQLPDGEPAAEHPEPPLPVADGVAVNDHNNHLPYGEPADEDQEAPLPVAGGLAVNDRISQLPDGVLEDIISLLPTKEGARAQLLAKRWRLLWRTAPLNLDYRSLCQDRNLGALMSRILSAHQGPSRRFCAPVYHLQGHGAATADAWLQSRALRDLQEIELCSFQYGVPYQFTTTLPSPVGAFRFSETLCAATIGDCEVPNISAQVIYFPKLKKLQLERVIISESSLAIMIKGCVALECLLIAHSVGFSCVRVDSNSLRNIGVKGYPPMEGLRFEELVIESAPCLETLLQNVPSLHTSVAFAPKLKVLGCLSSDTRLIVDSTVIQGLRVDSLMSEMRTVKILAIDMDAHSLDTVLDLMRCFPCLERLYIESVGRGENNSWRRKHKALLRSFDISLKKISWRYYRRIKSHVDFATFFVLNARVLDSMTFQVYSDNFNDEFIAEQRELLQLDSRVSRDAQFRFTPDSSHRFVMDFRVNDLELADPFEVQL